MRDRRFLGALTLLLFLLHGCSTTRPMRTSDRPLIGIASWYGEEFAGRVTANGEVFDPFLLTAAHRSLPFGTLLEVRNQENGRTVRVRVNDRGPFVGKRILDLSYAAAKRLDMVAAGVQKVEVRVVTIGTNERVRPPLVAAASASPKRSEEQSRTTLDPSMPPAIDFPTPEQLSRSAAERAAADAQEAPVEQVEGTEDAAVESVDVQVFRSGVRVRKEVSADGKTIVEQPANEEIAHAGPMTVVRQVPSIASTATSSSSKYLLQLGAFSSRENAELFRERVRVIVDKSYIEEDGSMFRVRVGPFDDKIAAIEAREKVEMNGISAMLLSVPR